MSESKWRANVFDLDFPAPPFTMAARVVSGVFTGRYITDQADAFGGVLIWITSFGTLPVVTTTAPKGADHFPYGFDVAAD